MDVLRVKDWDHFFENNRTRELKHLDWVLVPNRHDGDGYRALISRDDGAEMFGCWILILEIASKCNPRGMLVRDNGLPHTAESIGRMTGADSVSLRRAIDILCSDEVGWLELTGDGVDPPAVTSHEKRRAHGRVANALERGRGVCTPAGILCARPDACQWCSELGQKQGKGFPSIVAHHPIGYGERHRDMTVIFVCRSCHGLMENERVSTADIMEKFGHGWLRQVFNLPCIMDDVGSESQDDAEKRLWKGMEGNGRELEDCSAAAVAATEQDTSLPPESVSFPDFPTAGKRKTWRLTDAHSDELSAMFPGIDVPAECRKAHGWIKAHLTRRKTFDGMKKFLFSWMSKAQDYGRVRPPSAPQGSTRKPLTSPRKYE